MQIMQYRGFNLVQREGNGVCIYIPRSRDGFRYRATDIADAKSWVDCCVGKGTENAHDD
jgi:hypothetical protein